MGDYLDVEEVLRIGYADDEGGGDEAEEEELGDWGVGEAGREHAFRVDTRVRIRIRILVFGRWG